MVDWSNFQGGTGNLREVGEGVLKNTGGKAGYHVRACLG